MDRSLVSALILLLAPFVLDTAIAAEGPPPACESAEHRQFDFWLGDWTVVDPGNADKVLGTNQVTSELGRCVLHEHWTGAKGFRGESFNAWDGDRGVWHQSWVDQGGGLLVLEGGLSGDRMILTGHHPVSGKPTTERITWTPQAGGTVRQLWETSTDDGKTWSVSFDGLYRKVAGH